MGVDSLTLRYTGGLAVGCYTGGPVRPPGFIPQPRSVGSKIFFLKILLNLVNKSAKNKNDILIGSDGRIFYMLVEN